MRSRRHHDRARTHVSINTDGRLLPRTAQMIGCEVLSIKLNAGGSTVVGFGTRPSSVLMVTATAD